MAFGILVGLGYGGWLWYEGLEEAPDDGAFDYTAKVQRMTIESFVESAGDVEPAVEAEIKSEVSARIARIHADEGEEVKLGQVIVEMDNSDLLIDRESAVKAIERAQLQLDQETRDFERNEKLFAKKLVSQQVFEDSRTELELAKNNFEQAEKSLQTVDDKLRKTRIEAPLTGTVLSIPVVEGQAVSSAGSANSGTLLMTIAQLSDLVINTHINQVDVASLRVGMPVSFTVSALIDTEMDGVITEIAPLATVVNNIKGFTVEVQITSPDPRLKPGMTTDITIPVDKVTNVLSVPLTAVFTEKGDEKVVFVKVGAEPPRAKRRIVEVGISNLDMVEIKSGLSEGDTVLLARPEEEFLLP